MATVKLYRPARRAGFSNRAAWWRATFAMGDVFRIDPAGYLRFVWLSLDLDRSASHMLAIPHTIFTR